MASAEMAYWIFPKPNDAGLILFNALDAHHHFEKPAISGLLESWRAYSPGASILSSFAISGVLLALAAHEFNTTDA